MAGRGPSPLPASQPRDASGEELGELIPAVGELAIRPKHAGGDLVADLDHVGHGALLAHAGDSVAAEVEDGLDEVFVGEFGPRLGRVVMAGVGPVVGVVKVKQDAEAEGFRGFGFGEGVGEGVG